MDGIQPAKVPDGIIAEIRSRERDGLIDIAKPPQFAPGMRVRVLQGPLQNQIGLTALRADTVVAADALLKQVGHGVRFTDL
jgi:hypothetical protein